MSHTASAPALKGQMNLKGFSKERRPRSTPKWLEHELMQERYCEQAMEDWRKDVQARLGQIRQKPRLNDALNVLVYQLKREGLTEGELFEKMDSNQDGELSRSELQAAGRTTSESCEVH